MTITIKRNFKAENGLQVKKGTTLKVVRTVEMGWLEARYPNGKKVFVAPSYFC